jgi:tetratricopeptide (TPR) repeat protein
MTRFNQSRACRAFRPLVLFSGIVANASAQFAATDTTQAAAAYRAGQAALSRNDLAAAQAAFEQSLRDAPGAGSGKDPKKEPILAALGVVLLRRGEMAAAVHTLEAAHALNKADRNVEGNLAIAYQQVGQPSKAVPLFADLVAGARLSKQPLPSSVRATYARALAATGKLAQAAIEMQAAVEADPNNAALLGDLGSIYAQQKQWPRAERAFRAMVALNPNAAIAHLRLGLAMQAQGEPGALAELAQAAQIAPDDATSQLEWGKALAASGDDRQAIPIFEHILGESVLPLQPDADPRILEATSQLAQAYQRTDRVPLAIELFKKVLAVAPDDVAALTNLGLAYSQMQQAKDAVPVLQRAVALAPGSVTAHQDLAAAYVQLSQYADAAEELRAALKVAPDLPQLHYNLGLALKNEDDAAGAIPELEQAEKLDPTAPEPPNLLGLLYLQAGRYAEAARELQTSLRLRPENGDGWATLGSAYNKLDRLPEAVAALQKAIQQLPSQPDPHLTLAAVLTRQNQLPEAAAERKLAATLMRANMNRQRAEVATNSGKALLKGGDLAGAAQQFQDALSYDAQYAEAHLGLASVYDAQGKGADAANERQKAAAGMPSKP